MPELVQYYLRADNGSREDEERSKRCWGWKKLSGRVVSLGEGRKDTRRRGVAGKPATSKDWIMTGHG